MFGGLNSRSACLVAASVLFWSPGCSIKATKLAEGGRFGDACAWRSEDTLLVRGINGRIVVRGLSDDQIVAEFSPFVLIADDATASEERNELEKLRGTVQVDEASRTITVETEREGEVLSSLGADITVSIPEEFDGPLRIEQENGPVAVESAARASRFSLISKNGPCSVGAGFARAIDVKCEFGDLTGSIGAIPEGFETARFATGRGDIKLRFPADDVYSVRAVSKTGGHVDTINAEDARCEVLVASDSSKTVVCNDATQADPVYEVMADSEPDAMLAHDVVLEFAEPETEAVSR
jgi:hypothetical protein